MPYYTVDEAEFEKAFKALNLTLSINLFTDPDPPEGIVYGIENRATSAMQDEKMRNEETQKIVDSIMAAYSPVLDEEDIIQEHAIWVRPHRATLAEMNISFLHEMIHASQMEAFGFAKYNEMDSEFMRTVGYDLNPFEMEADYMSHFMVLELKVTPFVEVEREE